MTVTPYHLDKAIQQLFDLPPYKFVMNPGAVDRYIQTSSDTAYTIVAPLMGVPKDNLKVSVVDNNLVVSAIPNVDNRWTKEFKQTWILNEDTDVNNINAKLENGLLTLTIPRIKPAKRSVNVTVQ